MASDQCILQAETFGQHIFLHEADESYGSFSQNLIVKLTMGDNCCVGDGTNTNRKVRSLIDRQPTQSGY